MRAVLLCVFVAAAMATNYTQCSEDPKCIQRPDHVLMNRVMPLVEASYKQCVKDGHCPTPTKAMSSTACVNGKAGEYECDGIDLLSFIPLAAMGSSGSGNDVWGWTDPQTKDEFAIMGCTDGTGFVNITDAANPTVMGWLPTQTGNAIWRDIKVHDNHAFVVSEASNHGMQVFDMTSFRGKQGKPLFSDEAVTQLKPDAHYTDFGNCHNIVINEGTGFAFAVGTSTCKGGLHMVDISKPQSPSYAGCFSEDGYTHDAECIVYDGPDSRYTDKEVCFNYNEDTLTIVDATDKANPKMLSRTDYPNNHYTHQGWLFSDRKFLVMNDELDEMYSNQKHTRSLIWNVEDLEKPVFAFEYLSPVKAIDHNLYIIDDLVYEANYASGLRMVKAVDLPEGKMEQVGFFDCAPNYNDVDFHGAWSVFPYYQSKSIAVSSIERGLFVLKLH